jgi:hypothetical protein
MPSDFSAAHQPLLGLFAHLGIVTCLTSFFVICDSGVFPPFLLDVMSQQPTRQSARIHCPSYRPRTTWALPEIVSVRVQIPVSHPSQGLIISTWFFFQRVLLLRPSAVIILIIMTSVHLSKRQPHHLQLFRTMLKAVMQMTLMII